MINSLKKILGRALIIIVALSFSPPLLAVRVFSEEALFQPRVALIGLDAAEWKVIDPLQTAGKLPVLNKLIENGVRAPLKSIEPTISPALWTTIITGKTRQKHGILNFVVEDKDGQKVPVTSNFRKVKALWNIVSERGLKTGFINWWPSYPAEQVNGFMVSNYMRYYYPQLFVHGKGEESPIAAVKNITFPEDLESLVRQLELKEAEFFRELDLEKIEKHRPGGAYDPALGLKFKDNIKIFKYAVTADELVKKIALNLLPDYPVDLFGIYFEGIDVLSHLFWKYSHPQQFGVTPEVAQDLGGIVEAYYQFSDKMVGDLVDSFSLKTDVIIVSDHGYGKVGRRRHFHQDTGIIILSGPSFKGGVKLPEASILDVTPTLLYLLGLPVARDMEGKVLKDAFTESFRAQHPLTWIDSYEKPGEVKEAPEVIVTPLDEEMRKKLRALGYIK